jgi:hypothetical protein
MFFISFTLFRFGKQIAHKEKGKRTHGKGQPGLLFNQETSVMRSHHGHYAGI